MFDRLRRMITKASKTGAAIYLGSPQAKWSKREYRAFADEAYTKNVIAYQAINKTAMAVATIPWIARRPSGDELLAHPMLDLINQPNPQQSRFEFLNAMVGFYRISGNAYIERIDSRGRPIELYTLRPDRMTVVPSPRGFPAGFVYRSGNYESRWEVDDNGNGLIRHLKAFHPLDDWYGLSPIEAGAYAVDQYTETMKSMQATLQNNMRPSGGLEVGELSDDQFTRLKAEMEEKYQGSANAGRPLLLEGGMKWVQMGLSAQDMEIIQTKYSAARDISLALGVPPLLLNIPGDSTYNNYKEARLAFYEETVIPLAHFIRDELNHWLSPYFGGVMLDIDLDQVPAIAEKRAELWEMADRSHDLTINEKRAMKGYEPIEGGDEIFIPSGRVPLSLGMMPEFNQDPADAARDAFGDDDADQPDR